MARSASAPDDSSRHSTPRHVSQRYRLDTPIGRGGAGVVWCGEDELLQRPVAIKEILVPLAGAQAERDAIRARVLREARALARLHSPAIVSVYDVVEEAERHWIVMELVDADSLSDVIRADGPLPPSQVAAIGVTLTDALAAAHSAGVLHRDIKPGNVLLGRDGRVRLTDFGIAATDGDSTLTGTGSLVGSPAYIAPERVRGSSGSPASDLWGLGATLYAAVEGQPPFEGPETYAVLTAVVEGRRRPFRLAGPLCELLTDLLDRPAEERPGAAEVRRRLIPIARGVAPVPTSVINSRPRPGVAGNGNRADPPTDSSADLLEDVGGDTSPPGDPDTPVSEVSPVTSDAVPVSPSTIAADDGTGTAVTTIAAANGVADGTPGSTAAPDVLRTVAGAQRLADRAGTGDAVAGVALETRLDPFRDKLTAVAGTSALTIGRASPASLTAGGYSFEHSSDLDGLLPVGGGSPVVPTGRRAHLDRQGKRRAPTVDQGVQPPVRRGAVVAVAAASIAVGAAIALSGLLSPDSGSGSQVQLNGDRGGAVTATASGRNNINPSGRQSALEIPGGVGRLPSAHRTASVPASASPEPTLTEATVEPPTSSPSKVPASPTAPATAPATTPAGASPPPTGSATPTQTP